MTDIDGLIAGVVAREGGYVDHPADRGGPTRFGITEAVARAGGYAGAIRQLPRSVAEDIYRTRYWKGPGIDRVARRAPMLAAELFDGGVNMGPRVPIGFLQRALNALNRGAADYPEVARDGRIGDATLTALDAYLVRRGRDGEAVLVKAIEALRGERYITLAERRPANEAFLYGWLAHRVGVRA